MAGHDRGVGRRRAGASARIEWRAPPTPYRGEDRRAPIQWTVPSLREFVLATLLLAALSVLLASLAIADPTSPSIDRHTLNAMLWTSCAVLALVAGFISCLRWRMVGDATSVRIGSALLVLGVLALVVDLIPRVALTTRNDVLFQRLNVSMTLTIATLLVVAVVASPIDTRVSVLRSVIGVVLEVALLFAVVSAFPVLETFGTWDSEPLDASGQIAGGAMVALWAGLAVTSTVRGLRRRSWLWTWLGLMLFGFALAGVFEAFATTGEDLWVTGSLVLRVLALLFVLNGVSQELKRAYLDQRARFFETRVSVEANEARYRAEQAQREERAHETRTALLAIQSATRRLETIDDGAGRQTTLRDALDAEIELLRGLVERDGTREACESFDLATRILPVVACQRAAGLDVRTELVTGLTAIGRPLELAQVVQTLLDNTRVHAAGSPVVVRTSREGSRALVYVEDRGPGVAAAQRDGIFHRGFTTTVSGTGLGLYVARQLVRDQGGDIWVEDHRGGGAAFVVALPVSPGASPVALPGVAGGWRPTELVHDLDHAGQLRHSNAFDAMGGEQ
jgi:signal transduction histidine kinase